MKRLLTFTCGLLMLVPVITFAGSRRFSTEDRDVSGFHGISSGGSYSVTVRIGTKEGLRLEGDADLMTQIITKVENGILVIRTKPNLNWKEWRNKQVKIFITAKSLNSLSVSGSGSVEVLDGLKASSMDLSVSGSGKLRANVTADDVEVSISGSGSADVSGSSKQSDISISGSGSLRGKSFNTEVANVTISGSGSAEFGADKTLNARLSGSGSVRYSGNATVNTRKSGSGRVVKV